MPEPDTPDTGADVDAPDSWRKLVTEYPGTLLVEFLSRADVRSVCINGAKEWGCPGYVALSAYGVLILAAKLVANQSSESALSFIEKWVVRFPIARRMLMFLSKTHADLVDKEAVRRHLIDALGAGSQAGGIDVDYDLPLELAQHLAQDQQLKALAEGIDDLRRVFPELAADALRAALQDEKQPVLGWIEQSGESQSGAARIRYNSGLFGFFGRDEQIRTLRDFCHEVDAPWQRFSWTLITGGGGMGKTRLAYEFTRNHLRKTWNAGSLGEAEAEAFDAARFRPSKPTLLVIDYPARRPADVRKLLASLKQQSQTEAEQGGYAFPVRVLLLERDTQGNWFSEMLPPGSDGDGVRSVYWGPDWAGDGIGWDLPLLSRVALLATMYDRLREAGITDLPEPEQLFEAALKVDSYPGMIEGEPVWLPRPLFAAATAEALVAARADGKDWATIVNALDRADVLDGLIKRDRANIWSKTGKGRNPDALALHENLLLLATFGLGLNREARAKAVALAGDALPELGLKGQWPIDHDLLHAMSGGDAGTINPLEPDIVGEYYVLTRLQQLDHDVSRRLRSASLAVNGDDAGVFILRCLRDFPALLSQLDFLAPDGESAEAALTFARAAVDLSNQLGEAQDWQGLGAVMDSVATLVARWPDDGEIALEQAKAAVNVSYRAGAAAVNDRDWTRVEAMLALLAQLRADWPDDWEIALHQAKAAVNVSSHAGTAAVQIGDWTRVKAMLGLLAQLRTDWPDDREIALTQAKAAVNVSFHAGAAALQDKDWTRVEAIEAIAASLLNDAHWPEAVILVAHNALILASWYRARGDALVPGASLNRALGSVYWLLTHLELEDANRFARRALQLIRAAHQRFPDDEVAAAFYRWVEEAGNDWSQVPPLD